jgi:hypothetical protein
MYTRHGNDKSGDISTVGIVVPPVMVKKNITPNI